MLGNRWQALAWKIAGCSVLGSNAVQFREGEFLWFCLSWYFQDLYISRVWRRWVTQLHRSQRWTVCILEVSKALNIGKTCFCFLGQKILRLDLRRCIYFRPTPSSQFPPLIIYFLQNTTTSSSLFCFWFSCWIYPG